MTREQPDGHDAQGKLWGRVQSFHALSSAPHSSQTDMFISPEALLKFLVNLYVGFSTDTKLIRLSVICD